MAFVAGKGTTLSVSVNSTFISVGQVVSISGPSANVGTYEVTDLDSSMRAFTPTIGDGGDISMACNYDPNNQAQAFLQGLIASPSTVSFRLVHPTTTKFLSAGGVLTGFGRGSVTVDNVHTVDISIKLSGSITVPTTT